jgi:hypothetical protein
MILIIFLYSLLWFKIFIDNRDMLNTISKEIRDLYRCFIEERGSIVSS